MHEENAALLRLEGVGKRYGLRRVLQNITLNARCGEVVVVTGENGSGKSTLLKIIAGLLRPSRGEVIISGAKEAAARRFLVGYAAPDLHLYSELTAHENLAFYYQVRTGTAESRERRERRLETVGLGGRGDDLLTTYSSGMRQRMRLAFATGHEVPLLLLDEPSLALDVKGVALVGEIIARQRQQGGATLLATNDPREATLGDRVIALGA
jgi:heme exporter protein A